MTDQGSRTGEMRLTVVIREALRDSVTAPARSLLTFGVASAVLISIGIGELQTTGRVLADEAAVIAAGGYTVVVSNKAQAVDTRTCLQAGKSPGVRHVAALGQARNVTLATAPHTRFARMPINLDALPVIAPGFMRPGDPPAPGGGWIVGGAAATELGVAVGDNLAVEGHVRRITAVIPEGQFRLQSLARSVMTVEPLGDSSERCVIDLERSNFDAHHTAVSAVFAHAGEEITVGVLHGRDPLVRPPRQALTLRPTRRTGVGGALVLGVVAVLSLWTRRTDLAVRRSVGATAWATTSITAIEHGLVLWPATTLAVGVTAVVGATTQRWVPADQLLIVARSIVIAGVGSFLPVVAAALLMAVRADAATLKDR